MRIGVIADIHSNLAALKAVLKDMPRVDKIICAGDLVGYAAEPNEVVELAQRKKILSVLGDHDNSSSIGDVKRYDSIAAQAITWTFENLEEGNKKHLRNLPRKLDLKIGGGRILVVHGSPRDPLFDCVFPDISNHALLDLVKGVDADIVVLGHTHIPMKRVIHGKLIINPGSVGQPRDRDPRASYMVLRINGDMEVEHKKVDYEINETAEKIKSAGLPEELAVRLYFGW